jgi:hypothetical protein
LAKSCCGYWPVHLPHKFEEKEKKNPWWGWKNNLYNMLEVILIEAQIGGVGGDALRPKP